MAIALIAIDTWISHLSFTGRQRPTDFGPADGVWFGLLSLTGDGSGGNLTLNGQLSFERKEDWVYVPMGSSWTTNSSTTPNTAFEQINTGPLIPTATVVNNPSFSFGGLSRNMSGNSLHVQQSDQTKNFYGMPVFGDKKLPGSSLMYALGFQTNVNAVIYTASIWGWLFRYNGFFRNEGPNVG